MKAQSLKSGWKMVKFGEVVKNANLVERAPMANGIARVVGLDHIDPENLHIRRWNSPKDGTSFTRKFVPGQTLFGKRRAYQRKVAYAEFEGICSGDILTFESKNNKIFLPELLPFICQSDRFFEFALGTSAGSLSPRTSWKALKDFEFALPPIEEQKRIAEILWAADDLSERKKHSINSYEKLELSAIKRLVDEALSNSNSDTQRLDEAVQIIDCKHITPKLVEKGVPMIAPGNISWGPLQLYGCKQVSKDDFLMLMDHVDVRPFDLILSRNQTYGIASYVKSDTEFAIGQDTVLIQPKEISTKVAFLLLKSSFVQRQINRLCSGSTFKRINLGDIKKLCVPIINEGIQAKAEKLFCTFENARNDLQHDLGKFSYFKNKLLNRLLSTAGVHV